MNGPIAVTFVICFLVDLLLLLGAVKLYGGRCGVLRIVIASLFAAAHGAVSIAWDASFIGDRVVRISVLAATGAIAFGRKRDAVWKTILFLLLDNALDGMMNEIAPVSGFRRLPVAFCIALLCGILRRCSTIGRPTAHIVLHHEGRELCLDALIDTGNDLTDIVTGLPVLVVCPSAAVRLTGLSKEQIGAPLDTLASGAMSGLRLIPFSSVGNSHGMMLGIRIHDVVVDGVSKDLVIAMAPEGMGKYEALIGGNYEA